MLGMPSIRRMDKQTAIKLFESASALARAVGCAPPSVFGWPDPLPPRIADRVIAALVRAGRADEAEALAREDGCRIQSGMTEEMRRAA